MFVNTVYLFSSFFGGVVEGGHQLPVGDHIWIIPGRALPLHVTVVEGRDTSLSEVCDIGQFPRAFVDWWIAQ